MNKFFTSTIVFIAITFFSFNNVSAQKFNTPVEYMQYISNEYQIISKDTWDYIKVATRGRSARKVEGKRKELIKSVYIAKNKISRMSDYEGHSDYKDSVVAYLDMNYKVLNDDFAKIVDMEAVAEESYDAMEAYMLAKKRANKKLDKAGKMVSNQQKEFAKNYNITLLESDDKISKKLDQSSEVIDYYNVIYLIFFKNYKQEFYLIEAKRKNDVNGIEQNKEALLSTVEEAMSKLDTIKSFKSDPNLKYACQQMLRFYKDEAENKVSDYTNLLLEKEKFEKIKKSFDLIKQSKRTQEDIDQYNAAIKSYNDAVNKSNATNDYLNTNRGKKLKAYNKAVDTFFDKHMP